MRDRSELASAHDLSLSHTEVNTTDHYERAPLALGAHPHQHACPPHAPQMKMHVEICEMHSQRKASFDAKAKAHPSRLIAGITIAFNEAKKPELALRM